MKRLAIAASLVLAACTSNPVPVPAPPPVPVPRVPPPPPREAPRPPKHEEAPPPQQSDGPLTRKLAGAYMDGEETELRKRLRGSGLRIARLGDVLVIDMSDDFLFDQRFSGVSWNASGALAAIAEVIQQYDRTLVQIGGYTDTSGSPDANMRASATRAKIIADMLVRDGVDAERISAQGYGEAHLLIPTGDNVNEPRNRRVEIRIVPKIEA
ncbi:MAG TPA: OmpA family protein [Rhizomicrobium sp.]|nr:OmpA family protein [Rhizomicrobium sp.]